jgi:periplasmic protein CpxP/Spy
MSMLFKNKLLTGLVILLLIANITTIIMLIVGMRKNHVAENALQPSEYLIKELDFNDAQKEQYKLLITDHRKHTKAIRDEIKTEKDIFYALLSKEQISDSIKNDITEKIASLNTRLDNVTFDHFKAVRKICTPVQQLQFEQVIKEVIRMMNRPAPRGQRPPPGARDNLHQGPPEGERQAGPPGDEPPPNH